MSVSISIRLLVTAAALVLATPTTSAKTIEVSKNGPLKTIQAGIDVAGPGDRVEVASGQYRENVVIPPGKQKLRLEGKGKVLIDALPDGGKGAGPGIKVLADGVRIEGLTIRNAESGAGQSGYGIEYAADDVRIEEVTVLFTDDDAIFGEGDRLRVIDCKLRGSEYSAIDVDGDDILIEDVLALQCGDFGFEVDGDRTRILGCRIEGVEDEYGIDISGDQVRVEDCKLFRIDTNAIDINGDEAKILDCEIRGCSSTMIYVSGDDARVVGNELSEGEDHGVEVYGDRARVEGNELADLGDDMIYVSGDLPEIVGNDLRDSWNDAAGIVVREVPSGGRIEENFVRRAANEGVSVHSSCANLLIAGNVVRECGYENESAIEVLGAGHVVRDNLARSNGGDGFFVRGSGIRLLENTARKNGRDGIDVHADSVGTELRKNVCKENHAEGIDNGGPSTVCVSNEALKNRIDVASSTPFATFQKNEFGTGGPTKLPERD